MIPKVMVKSEGFSLEVGGVGDSVSKGLHCAKPLKLIIYSVI